MSRSEAPDSAPPEVRAFAASRIPGARIEPLEGDASSRSYFRVQAPGGPPRVVASYGEAFDPSSFPFLETTALLEAIGIPVPCVLDFDAAAGMILLDDLGDRSLQAWLASSGKRAGEPDARDLYMQAVDLITRLQQRGTPRLHPGIHAGRTALDAARFRFELNLFFDQVVTGLRGRSVDTRQRALIGEAFDRFCRRLDRPPLVLCHRDFHSRNLMVAPGGELIVLDHQDARRGPETYDLASLLCDPYVDVPEERGEAMIRRFHATLGGGETLEAFRLRVHEMSVQRALKAAGTFANQKLEHGRARYLSFLPAALTGARRNLELCPDLDFLREALAPWVEEFSGEPPA
ncbi:MAG: aminoglycoside phosphotransferase family protein [Acidobacteriota bacterium]